MDFGKMIKWVVMEELFKAIKIFILVCGIKVKKMGMVFWLKIMEIILKENGLMIKEKVKVVFILVKVIKLLLVNGLMIVLKMLFILMWKLFKVNK